MAKKWGFNDYEIKDGFAIFFVKRKDGNIFEVIIDIEDIQKLIDLNWHWHVSYKKNSQSWYVEASVYRGNGQINKTYYLHKVLTGAVLGQYVDHKNNNTLDNRKDNLRVTENKKNTRNRKSKNSNNKSGYRNVSWNSREDCWIVQLQINGKNTILDKFNDVDEAGVFAEKMRKEYYGEFAGNT